MGRYRQRRETFVTITIFDVVDPALFDGLIMTNPEPRGESVTIFGKRAATDDQAPTGKIFVVRESLIT